jgi:hypothetical protein
MNAWIYQSALLCDDCARDKRIKLNRELVTLADRDGNSDMAPQGPYANGGGEADCPQSCDLCGTFLENPLTDDGIEYVKECIRNGHTLHASGRKLLCIWSNPVVKEWSDFYEIQAGETD